MDARWVSLLQPYAFSILECADDEQGRSSNDSDRATNHKECDQNEIHAAALD
jgi:hypothetical protein